MARAVEVVMSNMDVSQELRFHAPWTTDERVVCALMWVLKFQPSSRRELPQLVSTFLALALLSFLVARRRTFCVHRKNDTREGEVGSRAEEDGKTYQDDGCGMIMKDNEC